jgi:tetratricopeptide (TPR) repeat protein
VREASAAFEQASARLNALGRDNTQRAALLFNNWGLALSVWGQPLDAERVLRRTIALSQDDRAQTTVPAMPLINYARALKELDRLDEAADYAERAHAKGLAAGDQSVVLNSLMMRAIIYRSQGKLEQAAQILSEIEPPLRRSLPAGHIAFPSLTMQLSLPRRGGKHNPRLTSPIRGLRRSKLPSKRGAKAPIICEIFFSGVLPFSCRPVIRSRQQVTPGGY